MADQINSTDENGRAFLSYKSEIKSRKSILSRFKETIRTNQLFHKDQRDFVDLNNQLTEYIQWIRLLEIENRKLILEIDLFQDSIQRHSLTIQNLYSIEICQGKHFLKELEKNCSNHQIQSIEKHLTENETEIVLYKRRLIDIEDEICEYNIEINDLIQQIKSFLKHIQKEIFLKMYFQIETFLIENRFDLFENQLSKTIESLRKSYEKQYEYEKDFSHHQFFISLYQTNRFQELIFKIAFVQNSIEKINEKHMEKTNEQFKEIQQMRKRIQQMDVYYDQLLAKQLTIQSQIHIYKQILQGRNRLQIHIDRIIHNLRTNKGSFLEEDLLRRISKESLKSTNLQDLKKSIFIDISGSTSEPVKMLKKSKLTIEFEICRMIQFDDIVCWNDQALICTDCNGIQSNGITNPCSIFENQLTKQIYLQSDIIFFLTDGQIQEKRIFQFSSNIKEHLNKSLIVCILIGDSIEDPSLIDVSLLSPFFFGINVLCLFYDGITFQVILSKGSIQQFYPLAIQFDSLTNFFNEMQLYKYDFLPKNLLIVEENCQEFVCFNFDKFLQRKYSNELILFQDNQWKLIVQYAKITNQLQQFKQMILSLKDHSNQLVFNKLLFFISQKEISYYFLKDFRFIDA